MERDVLDSPALPLRLELRSDGGAVTGRVVDERGDEHPFTGWLGLLTLLHGAQSRATTERPAA